MKKNLAAVLLVVISLIVGGLLGKMVVKKHAVVSYADLRAEVVDQVSCFPRGIDLIGWGKETEGMAIWNECWDDSLVSYLNFANMSLVCPGEDCPIKGLKGAELRAAIVKMGFEASGFIGSHHQLDTMGVEFDGPNKANVNAKIMATHFREGKGAEIHFVLWDGVLEKKPKGWRIVQEEISTSGVGVLPLAQ